MPQLTKFALRGDRDYVHGTLMLDSFRALDPDPTAFDVQFRKVTGRHCLLETVDDPSRRDALVARYESKGLRAYLYETDDAVNDRYPCNERDIVAHVQVDENGAHYDLGTLPSATPIQCIVAMYKHLLSATFPDYPKKYLFARLSAEYLPSAGRCTVRQQRRLGDDFFEGRVLHNGRPIGSIYFGAR